MHLFHIKMYYRIMLSPCDKDPQNLVMCQISFTCSKTLVVGRRFVGYIHMKHSRFFTWLVFLPVILIIALSV